MKTNVIYIYHNIIIIENIKLYSLLQLADLKSDVTFTYVTLV